MIYWLYNEVKSIWKDVEMYMRNWTTNFQSLQSQYLTDTKT